MSWADPEVRKTKAAERYAKNKTANVAYAKAYRENNPGKYAELARAWKKKNAEKVKAQHERRRRRQGNKERLSKYDAHVAIYRRWCKQQSLLHDAHVRTWRSDDARMARWRMRFDPDYVINMRMRVAIRKALKGGENGRTWESLVGYTLADLRRHLQRMMPKGYSLGDLFNKRLHIDHIIPKSTFDMTDPIQLKQAWSLANLRPIPASENHSKGSKRVFLL